jgi:hypothetical protein
MVLDHVAQGTGMVVVFGASFEGERLVPDDLDLEVNSQAF